MTSWLAIIAWVSVFFGLGSFAIIAVDVTLHKQHMWIMNVVWPVTGLWAGPLGVWAYYRFGRLASLAAMHQAKQAGTSPPSRELPMAVHVGEAATHCGSGCTLGDITAELLAVAVPFSLFGRAMFGAWIYDFVLAFGFGIAFQYFTIKPMRHISRGEAIRAALKADTLSLVAWQVGMYGFMALAVFVVFRHELQKSSPEFWFMMQLAMMTGFLTSYPVNWWLVRRGLKERM